MLEWVVPILIGLAAGVSGGLFGIGGGIIIVPALIGFLHFTQHRAQGTSLMVLVVPVLALGVYNYHRQGNVDFRVALLIAAGMFFGAFAGSKFATSLPEDVMRKVFAVFLVAVAIHLFFKK